MQDIDDTYVRTYFVCPLLYVHNTIRQYTTLYITHYTMIRHLKITKSNTIKLKLKLLGGATTFSCTRAGVFDSQQ